MSLSLALNNALTGLKASQQSLAVLSHNVANANTPGYSRQIVQQSQQIAGTQAAGTRIDQIVRKIDLYLNRAVQQQTSAVSAAETMSDYMSRIQILMGEPGGTNSLDEQMENFFNMLQTLATSPEQASSTYQAVQSGAVLANELSTLAYEMESLRFQADQDLQAGVDFVNEEILRLQQINTNIQRAYTLGESVAGLLDQRDASIRSISQYMDVNINTSESGVAHIYTNSGVPLLDEVAYRISYSGANAIDTFTSDGVLGAMTIVGYRTDGTQIGTPFTVVSSGVDSDITHIFKNGKFKALLDLRDKEIPAMLSQLDQIASVLRDSVNAIHNNGSGMPPATTLTGTLPVRREDALDWTGTALISVVNPDGSTPGSRYASEEYGVSTLALDFDALRSEYGDQITVDTIIKEINSFYTPQNHAVVGGLNNISLASLSRSLPGTGTLEFDFDLQNLGDAFSSMFVGDVRVYDDSGAAISAVTQNVPSSVTLDTTNTFLTTLGSNVITVNATGHGLAEGETITFDALGITDINGIPASELSGHSFRVTNVTANGFDIEVNSQANASSPPGIDDSAASILAATMTTTPGKTQRTGDNGSVSVDLTGFTASQFYTVQVDVMVDDGNGNLVASTVSYRVANNQADSLNSRYAATALTGAGTLEAPTSTQPLVKAMLVNAKGQQAGPNEVGYLKLVAQNSVEDPTKSYSIAINDGTSKEQGNSLKKPPQPGTNRGFSHYFGLNDLFVANATKDGKVSGSALNMAVRADILANPNLVSTGSITQGLTSSELGARSNYTYERTSGDNTIAQKLADLGLSTQSFAAAGGLSSTKKTFNSYASEVLSFAASRATSMESAYSDSTTLLDSYQDKLSAGSGVNIDEEMANTIILQNAYSGSAQVIKAVQDMFDALLSVF